MNSLTRPVLITVLFLAGCLWGCSSKPPVMKEPKDWIDTNSPVRFREISSSGGGYCLIKNVSKNKDEVRLDTWVLRVGKRSYKIPSGTTLQHGQTLAIYFFADEAEKDQFKRLKKTYDLELDVTSLGRLGKGKGEVLILEDADGTKMLEKTAP